MQIVKSNREHTSSVYHLPTWPLDVDFASDEVDSTSNRTISGVSKMTGSDNKSSSADAVVSAADDEDPALVVAWDLASCLVVSCVAEEHDGSNVRPDSSGDACDCVLDHGGALAVAAGYDSSARALAISLLEDTYGSRYRGKSSSKRLRIRDQAGCICTTNTLASNSSWVSALELSADWRSKRRTHIALLGRATSPNEGKTNASACTEGDVVGVELAFLHVMGSGGSKAGEEASDSE